MSLKSLLKGFVGEALGSFAARLFLDPEQYRSLNNVTLQTGHGTVQIDHVIVSRFGVFVVETKNYQHLMSLAERHGSTTGCPKCGAKLVQRTAKRGDRAGERFLACRAFPNCRYTKPVDG